MEEDAEEGDEEEEQEGEEAAQNARKEPASGVVGDNQGGTWFVKHGSL